MLYPAEADDDHVTTAGIIPTSLSYVSFLRGWNFTTTMYRVLEHLVDQLRMVRRTSADSVGDLFRPLHSSSKQVLDRLMLEYSHLPDVFKVAQAMTGDVRIDRFGFQAANIIITFQTVKLALAAAEDIGAEQRCAFARELISALAAIPTAYIAAVSRPIVSRLKRRSLSVVAPPCQLRLPARWSGESTAISIRPDTSPRGFACHV